MKITSFFKFSPCFLLITLPFWDVIVPFFTRFSSVFFYIVGPIRYEIMLFFTLCSIFYVIKIGYIKFKYSTLLLLVYIIICFYSLILSSANLELKIEAVKLQLIIFIYCFSLLVVSKRDCLPDLNFIRKTFFWQLLIVIFVGVFEVLNQNILTFLYNKPLDEIQHINYFSSQRIISLIGNPINLGAFILTCISFNFSKFSSKNMKVGYFILLFLSGFIIYMTLSRLSLISFVFLVLMIFYIKGRFNLIILIFSIGFLSMFLIQNINFDGLSAERMISIFNVSTYEDNARVINWYYALEHFENVWDYILGIGFGYSNPSIEYLEKYGSFIIENTFVSVFIELGILGLTVFSIILFRYIYMSIDFYKKTGDFSFISFLLVFILYSMGNDFHRNMPFSFYFWFFYIWLELNTNYVTNEKSGLT